MDEIIGQGVWPTKTVPCYKNKHLGKFYSAINVDKSGFIIDQPEISLEMPCLVLRDYNNDNALKDADKGILVVVKKSTKLDLIK